MPSLAIVGFSNNTFDLCKKTKADEVWTMNHAYLVRDFPRIDRLFEIHKRDWYSRLESKKAPEYMEWLKQEHPFPIFMEEIQPDVPSSVRYPFEEIVGALLSGLVWVTPEGKEVARDKYFTSSFSYMIAQAIYECYDPIEIYGIEMDGDTEYGYQRPNGEFWIGLALGRGHKVILQEACNLCSAPLYGYQGVPYIDANDVKSMLMDHQVKHEQYKQEADVTGKLLLENPDDDNINTKYKQLSALWFAYEGSCAALSRLIHESDTYISRQFLEMKRAVYINSMEYYKAQVNVHNSAFHELKDAGLDYQKEWQEYLNARASMFANMGANQILKKLMMRIDFRPVDFDLIMEIVEA